jgi:hypothetical protein
MREYLLEKYGINWAFDTEAGVNYYDMVDLEQIDPGKMALKGTYTALKRFLDKLTAVNFKDLVSEIENSCSSANLFTFVIDTNLYDAIELIREAKNRKVVTIKAGTKCGLFSSMYGGGSTLDLTLEKDLTTPLQWGTYDRLLFVVDGTDGYSIEETYCPSSNCFSKGGFVLS